MSLSRWFVALSLVAGLFAGNLSAQETFRYKQEKGQKLIYRTSTEMTQTQTVLNMKIENTMSNESISSRTVEDIAADGTVKFNVKTELFKVKSKFGPLGEFKFDSKSTERERGSVIADALNPVYERLGGAELQVFVTPRGEVKEVTGYAELLGDLVRENPLVAQFTGGGTNAAAKISTQALYTVFSEKPVKPGETWENPFDIELPGVGKTKGKETITYVGPDKVGNRTTAKFTVATEMSFDLNLDMNGTKVTGTISTSESSGTVQFDPAAGQLVSAKNSFTLSGELNVNANGMNIPVQSSQVQTVTTEQLDKLPE